jgi:hypothetical protein
MLLLYHSTFCCNLRSQSIGVELDGGLRRSHEIQVPHQHQPNCYCDADTQQEHKRHRACWYLQYTRSLMMMMMIERQVVVVVVLDRLRMSVASLMMRHTLAVCNAKNGCAAIAPR